MLSWYTLIRVKYCNFVDKIGAMSQNLLILNNRCCGCSACSAACPKGCIKMQEDAFGFAYPFLDVNLCVHCCLCERVCPVLAETSLFLDSTDYWAAAKDKNLKEASSSGGVFGLLAQKVISEQGSVYGAAFTNDCKKIEHCCVDNADDLDALMRSKYLQSTIKTEIYKNIARELREGKRVLFAGTPCQVSAMSCYLRQFCVPTSTLMLIDLICHGVPSPKLWSVWVDKKAKNGNIASVNFRSKKQGWLNPSIVYGKEKGIPEYVAYNQEWYIKAFLNNASLRPSCFCCSAKCTGKSDITLGDFWGFQDLYPEIDCSQGISAVLCNTPKGKAEFFKLKEEIHWGDVSRDQVLAGNPSLASSAVPYRYYDAFMADLAAGYSAAKMRRKWPFDLTFSKRVQRKLRKLIRRFVMS